MTNAFAAAMVGGTGSAIGGGKFANGAVTGAFSRLFNDLNHPTFADGWSDSFHDELNEYPLERKYFMDYASHLSDLGGDVRIYELHWRNFDAYARDRAFDSLLLLNSSPMSSQDAVGLTLGSVSNMLGKLGGLISGSAQINTITGAGVYMGGMREAMSIKLHGPSYINESTFKDFMGRSYDKNMNSIIRTPRN